MNNYKTLIFLLVLILFSGAELFAQAEIAAADEQDVAADSESSLFGVIHNINKSPAFQFLKGVPIYSDGLDYSMRLGGRIHIDTNQIEGVYTANEGGGSSENNLFRRRLSLELRGLMGKNWDYKAQVVGDEDAEIDTTGDLYANYHGDGIASLIRFGKAKEPLGLEQLTTSNAITTTERTAASTAFAPGRNIGVTFYGTHKEYKYGIGFYHNNNTTDNSGQNYAITARAVKPFIRKGTRVVHFGGGVSFREGNINRILLYPEVREVQQSNRISSGNIEINSNQILNLELIYIEKAFHLSAETYAAHYNGNDNNNDGIKGDDLDAYGGYVTVGYFLTGEVRPYNNLYGGFNIIVPKDPNKGAWEVFARISHIDLQDNDQGNKALMFTSGVNWYINRYIRVMLDYSHADYDRPPDGQDELGISDESGIDTGGDALTMRMQFAY